ncbi:MAG: hypothetical protein E6J90_19970 [Deltaproteobacteria bacterium]|nr:MAG: hypothetical protein E6J90_19970 [Deltaproteobacteria bacterium]
MKQILFAAMIVFATAGTASAGGVPGSIGVGAELELSNLGGVSANYDAGRFHVGGFIGFNDPSGASNETLDIGGRFFFHIASTATSDFSIGGGLGIESANHPQPQGRTTALFLEPGALSFTGGLSIGTVDASSVKITGDFTGTAGVHYYF